MRGILMVVVLVASWAGFEARGAEDAPAKPGDAVESKATEPRKEAEPRKAAKQSWTIRGGTMLRVGPDGKVTTIQMTGELPEEVAKAIAQLKAQMKEQFEQNKQEAEEAGNVEIDAEVDVGINVEIDDITDAWKAAAKLAAEASRAVGPNLQGSITVVGPDGTVRKHTFGGTDATSGDLFDVIGRVLEEQGLDQATIDGLRKMLPKTAAPKPGKPAPASDAVTKKLDLILERLDGLEKEIASLKATQHAKPRTE